MIFNRAYTTIYHISFLLSIIIFVFCTSKFVSSKYVITQVSECAGG